MNNINILLSVNDSYVDCVLDLLNSIYQTNNIKINVHLIYNNITEENINRIDNYLKIKNFGNLYTYLFNMNDDRFVINVPHISKETYYRLYAAYLLSNDIDRVLYLDADIICDGSIEELYNTDLEDNIIGACINVEPSDGFNKWINEELGRKEDSIYVNAGVLLIDLNKYREYLTIDDINNFIDSHHDHLPYQDQDTINTLFEDKIKVLDDKYNYQINYYYKNELEYNKVLYHFSSPDKPWNDDYLLPFHGVPYYRYLVKNNEINKMNNLLEKQIKNCSLSKIDQDELEELIFSEESIDIIIPIYNSRETIVLTLESIKNQKIDLDLNIYIIDDNSDETYEDILEWYSPSLNITYLKLDENRGPGYAREYGIEHSNGKYIIFLDSDDIFYNYNSISILYNAIKSGKYDVVRSVIHEETDDGYIVYENENIGLHGKIYRRKFLKDNNIKFNDTRSNEDVGFNLLLAICDARYNDIKDVTYIWCNNKNSLTRSNKEEYRDIDYVNYSYNLYWAFDQAALLGIMNYYYIIEAIVEIYIRYTHVTKEDIKDKIISNAKKICAYIDMTRIFDNAEAWGFNEKYGKTLVDDALEWAVSISGNNEFAQAVFTNEEQMDRDNHIKLLKEFNDLNMTHGYEYNELINKIFASVGEGTIITPPLYASWGGKNISIGSRCFINFNVTFVDDGKITIGDHVLIGPSVNIMTVNHPINVEERIRYFISIKDVTIKDNVWIGGGVNILPGVTIGENSVIGSGSVVTKDIPPNVIAYGNPCRVIRSINEEEQKHAE